MHQAYGTWYKWSAGYTGFHYEVTTLNGEMQPRALGTIRVDGRFHAVRSTICAGTYMNECTSAMQL